AGLDRHACVLHRSALFDLVAHHLYDLGTWADECYVAVLADLRKNIRFGQKAVARMDRIDIRDLGRADDGRNIEIAFGGCRRADADRLVGVTHMERVLIDLGMHGDGFDSHLLARPNYPAGDLAAVRDQNFSYLFGSH